MNVIPTEVLDVYILEPKVFGDHRGWFMETWSTRNMEEAGLHYNFVQDNQSYSAQKGTLRGIHFQKGDAAPGKAGALRPRCGTGCSGGSAQRFSHLQKMGGGGTVCRK